MKFKTDREAKEWEQLRTENPRLHALVWLMDEFSRLAFKKEIVVTSIFRTQAEHDALYAQTNPKPPRSPHMSWEGTDLRSSIYTQAEIDKMLAVANAIPAWGGQRKAALYHTIKGNVAHFHLQLEKGPTC